MPDPIAEAFVRLRPDVSAFDTETQRAIQQALGRVGVPAASQRRLGQQAFGNAFAAGAGTGITGALSNLRVSNAVGQNFAQQLFGPGFRNEAGRAIQGTLVGLGGGQLAAQFAFFGPGGAALATLGAGFLVAAKSAATFDQELEVLRATTQASEADIERARAAARALGADLDLPGQNATDAARAITELSKAGLDLEESIAGAEGTMQLAIAAEVDVATASQIAAAGLNAFNLAGSEAVHVADLLAGASIAAQGDIGDMALALQQSAAVADQAGLEIDDLVGIITLLARQGILGSDAGTSIRTMLLRLIPTTKEAAQFMEALGVQIDQTRTLGEQLPEIVEQYRAALQTLPPVLRQAALQQIFGTDAIRSATVVFEAGSAGLEDARQAADRQGAAADLAAARNKGLTGAVREFTKNVTDLAIGVGQDAAPALETYLDVLNLVIGAQQRAADTPTLTPAQELIRDADLRNLDDAVNLMETLQDRISEIGDNPVAEEAFTRLLVRLRQSNLSLEQLVEAVRGADVDFAAAIEDGLLTPLEQSQLAATETGRIFLEAFLGIKLAAEDGVSGTKKEVQKLPGIFAGLELPPGEAINPDKFNRALDEVKTDAGKTGKDIGTEVGEGIGEGIDESEQRAIDAARRTLESVRREGAQQIQETIRSARSNLEGIGASIGDALSEVIDEGPIGDAIDRLDQKLAELQERVSRRQLRFDLTQARTDLREAQEAIAQVGKLTPAQKKSQEEFLAPFRERIKDAKSAVQEFDLSEHRDDLQETLERQKRLADEGLQRLIDKFEEGKISVDEFDRLLSQQLQPHLATIRQSGENLGFVFTRDFKRDMEELVSQAKALAGFTGRAGTTPGQNVVRPAETVADIGRRLADAERALAQAIKDAKEKNTEENDDISNLLVQIRNAVRGSPTKSPTPPGPR